MSASDTAMRVIDWASSGGHTSPPHGDVRSTHQLARPDAALRDALAALCSLTGARLQLSEPPFGGAGPVGLGALVLAAGLGAAGMPPLARAVLSAVPPVASPADLVTRHGLAGPALRYLTPDV